MLHPQSYPAARKTSGGEERSDKECRHFPAGESSCTAFAGSANLRRLISSSGSAAYSLGARMSDGLASREDGQRTRATPKRRRAGTGALLVAATLFAGAADAYGGHGIPPLSAQYRTGRNLARLRAAAAPLPNGDTEVEQGGRPSGDTSSGQQSLGEPEGMEVQSIPSALSSDAADGEGKWDVYVCQSKPCKEKGSGATLDAFAGLAPRGVIVHPAIFSKTKKGKGPNVRCVMKAAGNGASMRAFEVNSVDSVDKVYRILTKHMGLEDVDSTACECLKWNYRGNAHLEKGEITEAIDAYGRAIATGYTDQEGVVLLMRATAYLKRAFDHQTELRSVVDDLKKTVAEPESLQTLYEVALVNPSLAKPLFRRVMTDCRAQDKKFRQIKFRHGMYEYALLHAAQDSLRATQLLPHYAKTWLRAGDSLAELRKLKESAQYYERAMELDPGLTDTLMPVVERLKKSQEFLDQARATGWPEDTLRLALDVAR